MLTIAGTQNDKLLSSFTENYRKRNLLFSYVNKLVKERVTKHVKKHVKKTVQLIV